MICFHITMNFKMNILQHIHRKIDILPERRERAMKEGSKFHVLILGLELLYDSRRKKSTFTSKLLELFSATLGQC